MSVPSPPSLPTAPQPALETDKGSKVGCIVGGCVLALFLSLAAVGLIVFLAMKYGEVGGAASTFSFSFDPERLRSLGIVSGGGISDKSWPQTVGDFSRTGPVGETDSVFGHNFLAGAQYTSQDGSIRVEVSAGTYETVEEYESKVNKAVARVSGGAASYGILGDNTVYFTSLGNPGVCYAAHPLFRHALYFSFSDTSGEVWDETEIGQAVAAFAEAVSGATPLEIGFRMTRELEGQVPYPVGPSLENGVAWYEPDPQEDKLSLARTGVPLPSGLAGARGEGATYSALNFEKDETLEIEAYFLPVLEEETLDQVFDRVLTAISTNGETIHHLAGHNFTVSSDSVPVTQTIFHQIEKEDGLFTVTTFENGVLLCVLDDPQPPTDAFPDVRGLDGVGFNFLRKIALGWHQMRIQ